MPRLTVRAPRVAPPPVSAPVLVHLLHRTLNELRAALGLPLLTEALLQTYLEEAGRQAQAPEEQR